MADQGIVDIVTGVLDGSTADELRAMRQANWDKRTELEANRVAAQGLSDPDAQAAALSAYQAADAALLAETKSVNSAITSYNDLAHAVQVAAGTVGVDATPTYLSGLGVAPIAVAAIAIAGVIAVAIAANAFSNVLSAARGDANVSRGYLDQLANAIQAGGGAVASTGDATMKIGIIALIGAAAYVGFSLLKKKGVI